DRPGATRRQPKHCPRCRDSAGAAGREIPRCHVARDRRRQRDPTLMAAAHLGHADTMGRAYPEAQMTSVAVGDLRSYPCVLYDPRGIEVVVREVPSWKSMEGVSDFVPLAGGLRH